ncbi:bacillithiol system redox-active protein YtxJ [Flavobacterium branchiophilum]|uniref:Bacillithiol system redox-active protein YtxJ n=1 Tax=Flavobacterium branchiophilum (strain FL-15) TaxID=1034807 RepID=G2Z0I2_FLABF|nr:bacillithiol system redox-active protein YtxJ [Flavobacterium branchiophilum]CCB69374.1 Protein of unknown function YtxJ [Flavobacterium branchiophilum FL-15]
MNWNILENLTQLEQIKQESFEKKMLVFKHSTRCIVSKMALKQFEKDFNLDNSITPYFLDLIANRHISNQIAEDYSVEHQSPQIILIENGKAIFNASHSEIDALELANL